MILPRTPQTLKWHLVVLYIVFPFILCCYCLLIARNSVCTFRPFLLSCVFALKIEEIQVSAAQLVIDMWGCSHINETKEW